MARMQRGHVPDQERRPRSRPAAAIPTRVQPTGMPLSRAALALRRDLLSSADVLALQGTVGNATVSRLLQRDGGPHMFIQRMGAEQFQFWFARARMLPTVEQRHAFLMHALGLEEFASFQNWLQLSNSVHEMWGQAPEQRQAPASGQMDQGMDVDNNQPQPQMGFQAQPQMGFQQSQMAYAPPQFGFGFQSQTFPQQPSFGLFAPPQGQLTPQQQHFVDQFLGEDMPGTEWREFRSKEGYTVNVAWHHILNHTYRYMYTTDSKPSHSLFPPSTSANDVGHYIQEAIEQYPNGNPTLSCGTVTVGWNSKNNVDSIVTFFPSLPDGHQNKLGSQQLELLREHYNFE